MGQSRMRIANWWYSRKEYSIAVKCYKKALQYYNNIPTNQVSSVTTHREKVPWGLILYLTEITVCGKYPDTLNIVSAN